MERGRDLHAEMVLKNASLLAPGSIQEKAPSLRDYDRKMILVQHYKAESLPETSLLMLEIDRLVGALGSPKLTARDYDHPRFPLALRFPIETNKISGEEVLFVKDNASSMTPPCYAIIIHPAQRAIHLHSARRPGPTAKSSSIRPFVSTCKSSHSA
ncbi:uncharacterized protein LY79DRAFT_51240 [Colletotrichum navitas]|uniref:Uncharacterized protein n=1 Tax=Colletotrichum navitas TaxID=681940 RepID=A0AAD8V890_9PEZI|nr:uncharacterized protein LY79DRAFT_51240 [Colletotrichum navitas]KAK1596689.1 hypothetical protein LY79DRAFT_51240 [Colletotrichum navitas]